MTGGALSSRDTDGSPAQGTRKLPAEKSEALKAEEACVFFMEVLLRHVFRIMRRDLAVLNAQLLQSSTARDLVNAIVLVMVKNTSTTVEDGAPISGGSSKVVSPPLLAMPSRNALTMHLGLTRLLLTLNSTALYHTEADGVQDLFTDHILTCSLLEPLLELLLRRLLLWGGQDCGDGMWSHTTTAITTTTNGNPGPLLYHDGCAPTTSSLFSGLLSVFGGGGGGGSSGDEALPKAMLKPLPPSSLAERMLLPWCAVYPGSTTAEALCRRSVELLALLALYRRGMEEGGGEGYACPPLNPARLFLTRLLPLVRSDRGSADTNAAPALERSGEALYLSGVGLLKAVAARLPSCPLLGAFLYVMIVDRPVLFHHALTPSPRPEGADTGSSGSRSAGQQAGHQSTRSGGGAARTASSTPAGRSTPTPISPHIGVEPFSADHPGGMAILCILYHLLEMSFRVNERRFDHAIAALNHKNNTSSSSTSTAAKNMNTGRRENKVVGAMAHTEGSSGNAAPLTAAFLGEWLGEEVAPVTYPHVDLLVGTLLLLFSQDRLLNRLLCQTPVSKIASRVSPGEPDGFLPSSYQKEMTMGSLAVNVLCLGVSYAVRDENDSLAHTFVVTLANISPFVHHVDPGSSQRLVKTIGFLLRRVEKRLLQSTAATGGATSSRGTSGAATPLPSTTPPPAAPAASHQGTTGWPYDTMWEGVLGAEACLSVLQVLVESIEGMLLGKHRHNESLIYELLYSKEQLVVHLPVDFHGASAGEGQKGPSTSSTTYEPFVPGEPDTTHYLRTLAESGSTAATSPSSSSPSYFASALMDEVARERAGQQAILVERRNAVISGARQVLKNIESIVQSLYVDLAVRWDSGASAEEIMQLIRQADAGGTSPILPGQGDGNSWFSSSSPTTSGAGAGGSNGAGANSQTVSSPLWGFSTGHTAREEWLLYAYEESPASYGFFGPLLWSLLLMNANRPGGMVWSLRVDECPLLPSAAASP